MSTWLSAFLITQLIECPIYVRALTGQRFRWVIAFGASSISHPLIFLVVPLFWGGDWLGYLIFAEGIAVFMETLWLQWWKVQRPLFWALLANGCSLATGLGLRWFLGWP